MPQFGRNLLWLDLFAYLNGMGNGVDPGRVGEHWPLEALLDHPAERDVVISEYSSGGGGQDEKNY